MRMIEIRRHSYTKKGEGRGKGSHLSAEGVALARQVGGETGPFDLVLTSPVPRSLETAVAMGFAKANAERIGAIAGDLAGAEEMFALKELLAKGGSTSIDCRQDGARLDPGLGRASYLFNSRIDGIDQADAILLIGANPRFEAAVLNARIRRRWRQGGLQVAAVGAPVELNHPG